MRLSSVEISGFRAFGGTARFDLRGDIILVVGANGQGKTSLFDAVHWAITGQIARLRHPSSVVSLYSASGEARVEVAIDSDDGRDVLVTRRSDGGKDKLLLRVGGDTFHEHDAEYELLRLLWPDALVAGEPREALRSALERGVYLQQDLLTDFLTAHTDQDRFNSISELIGAGRITELQSELERSRSAWSRVTNEQSASTVAVEERLDRLNAQLGELAESALVDGPSEAEWNAWWTQARVLGLSTQEAPRIEASDAHSTIDVAMAELRALRFSLERRGNRLRELRLLLRDLPPAVANLDTLNGQVEAVSQDLEAAQKAFAEAEAEVAETRRKQVEARSEQEELRVLAEITLRHLGEKCPVCQQIYDIDSTRERLESILRNTSQPVSVPTNDLGLIGLLKDIQATEESVASARVALREAQRLERVRVDGQEQISAGLAELAINLPEGSNAEPAIESALEENMSKLEGLSLATQRGETLALSLARRGQLARKAELEQEVLQVRHNLSTTRNEIEARQKTGEVVSKMINGLRSASSELVAGELVKLEPLLQRIYSTADPHPEFRIVKLLSRMRQGRGRVLAEVEDPTHDQRSDAPGAFLSSSQMNVLAVSVFLALNLGIPTLPLKVAILDDPLQSLDDLNLLGLIDLLKRMRERRQLIVSTHDSRFTSLLERKLRPVSESQRTILIELSGWSSEGPRVAQRDVERDQVPIRIAVA